MCIGQVLLQPHNQKPFIATVDSQKFRQNFTTLVFVYLLTSACTLMINLFIMHHIHIVSFSNYRLVFIAQY